MNAREVQERYRSPDRAGYPELSGYTRKEIYEDCMGGGALYLAARMARTMRLEEGDIVLDLGCGKGDTSVFLAQSDQEPAIPEGFERAATQALRGIQALTLPVDGLLAALREGGLPCTQKELKQRFDGFVEHAMRGHDPRNTRLTLDQ